VALREHFTAVRRARKSLDGLSVGDAFGERFFGSPEVIEPLLAKSKRPRAPWQWTDDTAMAISIVENLETCGGIDMDSLATAFGARYALEPQRGYGGGAHQILSLISRGTSWHEASRAPFAEGSYGNGGAMRAAPIGAYFSGEPDQAEEHGARSALPTHGHPDGIAGAIAVAVAASLAPSLSGYDLIREVLEYVPYSETAEGLYEAAKLGADEDPRHVAELLGSGARVSSQDTVPFSIYCAAYHLYDFEEALFYTVKGLGDRDTTCAIVGGIVACVSPIPSGMLAAREPLP
jgi:ADP-ribosylglycohydrolase